MGHTRRGMELEELRPNRIQKLGSPMARRLAAHRRRQHAPLGDQLLRAPLAMISDFWLRLALASLVIVAIWNAVSPGMIGEFLWKRLDPQGYPKRQWFAKPLALCPPCMASVHGSWLWMLTGGHWTDLPLFVLALSGALVIVTRRLLSD